MRHQRQVQVPRWAVAVLTGLVSAAVLVALIRLGLGFDLGLPVFVGGALGLAIGLLVARRVTEAELVIGVVNVAVSALLAVLSIVAAIFSAFS